MKKPRWEIAQEAEQEGWQSWKLSESKEDEEEMGAYWGWYLDIVRKYIPLKHGDRVLDIGSGPDGIIKYVEAKERFVVDPLSDFYLSEFELPSNIVWKRGIMESIPFKNGYFDIVFTTNTLDHTWRPSEGLSEIYRVIKTGGFLILTVNCYGPFRRFLRIVKEKIGKGEKPHPWSFSSKEVVTMITQAGFRLLSSSRGIGVMGCHFDVLPNDTRFILRRWGFKLMCQLEEKAVGYSYTDFIFIAAK